MSLELRHSICELSFESFGLWIDCDITGKRSYIDNTLIVLPRTISRHTGTCCDSVFHRARWQNTVMSESGSFSVGDFTDRDDILWRIEELSFGDVETINVCKDDFLSDSTLCFDDAFAHADEFGDLLRGKGGSVEDCTVG